MAQLFNGLSRMGLVQMNFRMLLWLSDLLKWEQKEEKQKHNVFVI